MKLLIPLLLAVAISSCTSAYWHEQRLKWFGDLSQNQPHIAMWSREDTTVDQFMKDRYECMKDAEHAVVAGGANRYFAAYRQDVVVDCGILSACMGGRGYKIDPNGTLKPPDGMAIRCR